jgi:hypothetical protein
MTRKFWRVAMRKLLFPLCTLGCVWALLALATWDLKSIRTRPTSLADIFQLKKPVDNFMSALIVDPTLGCDFNCDKNVRKADRLYHEKVKIEKKKEALIAKLKKERDSLERTLFEKAIGFHRDQLTRAVDKAKSVIQENSDIKQRSISRKVMVRVENGNHCVPIFALFFFEVAALKLLTCPDSKVRSSEQGRRPGGTRASPPAAA